MDSQFPPNPAGRSPRKWKLRLAIFLALLGTLIFLILVLLRTRFHGIGMHMAANEASAVFTLRTLTELQQQHATAHPANGFSCILAGLKLENSLNDHKFTEDFLASGERYGYRFQLSDCEPDAKGAVTHYRTTAMPLVFGKTGIRAFCTDESGGIWFDNSGSPSKCWLRVHQLN
jgi:hypothetical protein